MISNLSASLNHNLKFLARYRHNSWKPDMDRLADVLARSETMSVRVLADQLAGSGHNLAQGLGWTYWSIWHGVAKANLVMHEMVDPKDSRTAARGDRDPPNPLRREALPTFFLGERFGHVCSSHDLSFSSTLGPDSS